MAIKVLLVEDDRALREALADTLVLAGHDYAAVGSAEEALLAVGREAFSLVVSDVNMPAWMVISCWVCCAPVSRNCRSC